MIFPSIRHLILIRILKHPGDPKTTDTYLHTVNNTLKVRSPAEKSHESAHQETEGKTDGCWLTGHHWSQQLTPRWGQNRKNWFDYLYSGEGTRWSQVWRNAAADEHPSGEGRGNWGEPSGWVNEQLVWCRVPESRRPLFLLVAKLLLGGCCSIPVGC